MNLPALCRPEAFYLFARTLPRLHTTDGLQAATVALAMHALDDADPQTVDEQLEEIAREVRSRVQHPTLEALIARLHEVLFDEYQFQGEVTNYYSPLNSYLPAVLQSRRGLPITLALVYKLVGERVGLTIEGVNSPGHFLVRVRDSRGWLIVDPFYGGAVLSVPEAFGLMERILGRSLTRAPEFLQTASHTQWVARMLANLQSIFAQGECRDDLTAMTELQALLETTMN